MTLATSVTSRVSVQNKKAWLTGRIELTTQKYKLYSLQNKFKVHSELVHCEQVHSERIGRAYHYNDLSLYLYSNITTKNKFQAIFHDSIEQVPGYLSSFSSKKKRSKRKLGGALLCLPYASLRGFCVSSGDTWSGFQPHNKWKQNTWRYSMYLDNDIKIG